MGVEAEAGTVHFGVARVDVHLPGVRSLKEKRSLLRRVIASLEHAGCAVAEVGAQDRWQRAVLGVTLVASQASAVDRVLDDLVRIIERDARLDVLGMIQDVGTLDADS